MVQKTTMEKTITHLRSQQTLRDISDQAMHQQMILKQDLAIMSLKKHNQEELDSLKKIQSTQLHEAQELHTLQHQEEMNEFRLQLENARNVLEMERMEHIHQKQKYEQVIKKLKKLKGQSGKQITSSSNCPSSSAAGGRPIQSNSNIREDCASKLANLTEELKIHLEQPSTAPLQHCHVKSGDDLFGVERELKLQDMFQELLVRSRELVSLPVSVSAIKAKLACNVRAANRRRPRSPVKALRPLVYVV